MKNFISVLINTFIVTIIFITIMWGLKIWSDKQVKVDCLNAQRHLIEYNVPIPEDLNSLCVELKYYE